MDELKRKLNEFIEKKESLVLETYFVLKKEDNESIKEVDLEITVQDKLKDEFLEVLSEKVLNNDDLILENISEATNEQNVLLKYNLESKLETLTFLDEFSVKEEFENYSFVNDELSEIKGVVFLVHIEDITLVAYKKTYPINLYRKDSRGIKLWKPSNNERFIEVTEDIYTIYVDIDFFLLENELYVLNLKILEKYFDFYDVIVQSANEAIKKIEEMRILVESDQLKEIAHEMSQARKLTKIGMHSPVIGNINSEDIFNFINNHPSLTGKFKYNEDETKIELNTKVSAKLFLKLLNDDYLLSELTQLQYDTRAKREIDDKEDI